MKRIIEVTVSPAGDISINAIGFQGPDCERATKALEEALGTVTARAKKPEYYARTKTRNRQQLGS